MADLVDHGVANQLGHLLGVLAVLLDGALVDMNGIRQDIAIAGVTVGQVMPR